MSLKIDNPGGARANIALVAGLVVSCALFSGLLLAQEKSEQKDDAKKDEQAAPAKVYNAEYAKLKNPEMNTPENITAGREIYQQFCSNCHGKSGLGDGGDNRGGTPIPNLVDDEWLFGATDGEIFMAIKEGTGSPDMQPYKDTIDEKETWQSVLFIRSIAKKK